jgi:hypothetical protein
LGQIPLYRSEPDAERLLCGLEILALHAGVDDASVEKFLEPFVGEAGERIQRFPAWR